MNDSKTFIDIFNEKTLVIEKQLYRMLYSKHPHRREWKIMKAVVVLDSMNIDEFKADERIKNTINQLKNKIDFVFVQDTVTNQYGFEYAARMESEGPEWMQPQEDVMEQVKDADILIVHWYGVNKVLIDAAQKLKYIGVMRSGLEHVNTEYAKEKGIVIQNCPGRLANSVADLALAFIIDETRGITRLNRRTADRPLSDEDRFNDASSRPLCMLTAGLIGFGIIARELAKRLKACGCQVMAYDPYISAETFKSCGVMSVTFDELLNKSDIVSIHVRLTGDTQKMIGAKEFSKMKRNAIFINTARAGLVDENALIHALETKQIRGAGLDVFSVEPPDENNPLIHMDNVTSTPHIGGVFNGMLVLSFCMALDRLNEFLCQQGE